MPLKILITGAIGSGKTTFVRAVSETDVVETDEHTRELTGKTSTTVALDYGQMTVDERRVHLFGTPGQERFAYMWEMLSKGADAMVVLLDATNDDAQTQTRVLLDRIRTERRDLPFVLAVTHSDVSGFDAAEAVSARFVDEAMHVLHLDARDADACRDVITNLLATTVA
jgi:hypothetical protein